MRKPARSMAAPGSYRKAIPDGLPRCLTGYFHQMCKLSVVSLPRNHIDKP